MNSFSIVKNLLRHLIKFKEHGSTAKWWTVTLVNNSSMQKEWTIGIYIFILSMLVTTSYMQSLVYLQDIFDFKERLTTEEYDFNVRILYVKTTFGVVRQIWRLSNRWWSRWNTSATLRINERVNVCDVTKLMD